MFVDDFNFQLTSIISTVLFLVFEYFLLHISYGSSSVESRAPANALRISPETGVKFENVAGIDEAKEVRIRAACHDFRTWRALELSDAHFAFNC